ncbi:hypothetical protein BDP27DRAFT_1369605 [Rhodocollybia butyracea]|uniref:Uncharacterized protein n=1 Tax=Rhodocollybia butyracea TaxID=206335 RepID=A0A9P5U0M2_9AGAR|nr:hypothetical protein BDP27DRAFT_1369605 [Rhodocollybia butyracea]
MSNFTQIRFLRLVLARRVTPKITTSSSVDTHQHLNYSEEQSYGVDAFITYSFEQPGLDNNDNMLNNNQTSQLDLSDDPGVTRNELAIWASLYKNAYMQNSLWHEVHKKSGSVRFTLIFQGLRTELLVRFRKISDERLDHWSAGLRPVQVLNVSGP